MFACESPRIPPPHSNSHGNPYSSDRTPPSSKNSFKPFYLGLPSSLKEKELPKTPSKARIAREHALYPASLLSPDYPSNSRKRSKKKELPGDKMSLNTLYPGLVSKFNVSPLQISTPSSPYLKDKPLPDISARKRTEQRGGTFFLESPILPKHYPSVESLNRSLGSQSANSPRITERGCEQENFGDGGLGLFLYPSPGPEGYWDLIEAELANAELDEETRTRLSYEHSILEQRDHSI